MAALFFTSTYSLHPYTATGKAYFGYRTFVGKSGLLSNMLLG